MIGKENPAVSNESDSHHLSRGMTHSDVGNNTVAYRTDIMPRYLRMCEYVKQETCGTLIYPHLFVCLSTIKINCTTILFIALIGPNVGQDMFIYCPQYYPTPTEISSRYLR
jgi:hypothetical protein